MSERERPPREETETHDVGDEVAEMEAAAESFLDVEEDIAGEGGRAVDVERVPGEAVPAAYPRDIAGDEALRLTVAVGENTVPVYFELAGGQPGPHLQQLLDLHDIPPQRFADLHGKTVPLAVERGHHVVSVPDLPRGSRAGVYGVLAGLGTNLLVVLLLLTGLGGVLSSGAAVLALLVANLLVLPVGTFLDARYLESETAWDQSPLFWTILATLPGANTVSALLYLWTRRQATRR